MDWIALIIVLINACVIAFLWVRGIDTMNTHHPNYKGDDFLHFDSSETVVKFPKKEIKNVKVKVASVVKKSIAKK